MIANLNNVIAEAWQLGCGFAGAGSGGGVGVARQMVPYTLIPVCS